MNVRPIHALTSAEIRELAQHSAERGERVDDVNPFAAGTPSHATFAAAFEQRAADLESVG